MHTPEYKVQQENTSMRSNVRTVQVVDLFNIFLLNSLKALFIFLNNLFCCCYF